MASPIWREAQKKWYAYFYDSTGKKKGKPIPDFPRKKQLTRLEKKEVQRLADAMEAESRAVSGKDIDLESAAAYWIDDCKLNLAEPTIDRYRSVIKTILAFYAPTGKRIPLRDFSPAMVRKWRDYRLTIRESNTVRNDIKAVSAFGNWCKRNELLKSNPCEFVLAPKKIKSPQPFPTNEEVVRLLELAKDPQMSHEHKGLAILGVYCGMRRGEILGLRWSDVHFLENMMIIEISKSKATRPMPMSNPVKQFLLDVPQDGPNVFHPRHPTSGRAIKPQSCTRNFNNWLKDQGFGWSHKALRHWFINRLRLMGMETQVRQLVAGHQDENVNALYCHPQAEEARPYIEKILE